MNSTDTFRRQHQELGTIAAHIRAQLDAAPIAAHSETLRKLLAQLSGNLAVHKSMEEEALYPRLREHADAEVRATTEAFQRAFGGAYAAFLDFAHRWTTADAIEEQPDHFVRDTTAVLEVLRERIVHENTVLYEMVDRLD